MSDILSRENGRAPATTAVRRPPRPGAPHPPADPTRTEAPHSGCPAPGAVTGMGVFRRPGAPAGPDDRTATPHPGPENRTSVENPVGGPLGAGRPVGSPSPATPRFRGRIGPTASSGFHAAPHRYHLYLSGSCPSSQRLAITGELLGLGDQVRVVALPPVPDAPLGFAALRPLYEATEHRHQGPWTAPVLCDGWSGRVVSNHAPHILRDLARYFPVPGGAATPAASHLGGAHPPTLYPRPLDAPLAVLETLIEEDLDEAAQRAGAAPAPYRHGEPLQTLLAALRHLEGRLASSAFLLGDALTGADVQLWVSLAWLDVVHRRHLDAEAVHRIAAHPRVWAYAQRLHRHPAFRAGLDRDQVDRWHRHHCRGPESTGTAVPLMSW